jgi:hypothetical protein
VRGGRSALGELGDMVVLDGSLTSLGSVTVPDAVGGEGIAAF